MKRAIATWELLGIPVIVIIGTTLHFAFAWFSDWWPVAFFAAVNESVWEHLKLAFWPAFFWALLEFRFVGFRFWHFWGAKGFALIISPLLITLMFYGYTYLLGFNVLALDIGIFMFSVACSQIVSMFLLQSDVLQRQHQTAGIITLVLQLASFSAFTYHPPEVSIFEDPRNGKRGILVDSINNEMNHTG